MRKRIWHTDRFGEFNVDNIFQRFSDEKLDLSPDFAGRLYLCKANAKFVTGRNFYRESADFTGWCKKQIHFILSGAGQYTVENRAYLLQKGEFIYLPTGRYRFHKIGDEPFEYVYVCRLPAEFSIV